MDPEQNVKPFTGESQSQEDWAHQFYGADQASGSAKDGAATTPPTPQEHPTQSFWHRLIHGADGTSRTTEMGRSLVRGAAGAVDETVSTVGSAIEGVAKLNGEQVSVPRTHLADKVGKRSDDPLASFAESVTQFALPFAATGALGIEEGLTNNFARPLTQAASRGIGFVSALTRGALTDFTAFNPYQSGLAELVAKAPVPVVKDLGKLLTVDPNDNELVARLKRSTEGMVAATTFDALLATAKLFRGSKVLEDAAAPVAEKEAAKASMTQAQETLKSIQDGTHATDEAVQVRPSQDGEGFVLEHKGESKDSPVFADRAEADSQAATMNMAARARSTAKFSDEQKTAVLDSFKEINATHTQQELVDKLTERGNFNVSYLAEPKESMSMIEAISTHLGDYLDKVQHHPDGVPVEDSFKMASQVLGGLTFEEAPKVLVAKLGAARALHVWSTATNMYMSKMGASLVKLAHIADARPHDLVANEEVKNGLAKYFDVLHTVAGTNSEVARTMRMMQERDNPLMKNASFKDASAEVVKKASAAEVAREQFGLRIVAGMEPRDIRATAKMLQLSSGAPRDLVYIAPAIRKQKLDGSWNKAMEWFSNALLSAPTTPLAAGLSGVTTNAFEAFGRMAAGVRTRNTALAREGADLMYGYFSESMDAIRSAMKTFQSGQSVINPHPAMYAITGLKGEAVRIPGKALMATDELVRVTAYRSYVRAKSLRMGRELGLAGDALDNYVGDNLRNAFTHEVKDSSGDLIMPAGVATASDALKFAEVPTFSGSLGAGTLGGDTQNLINNHLSLKWIAPFVKASVNIFRYAHAMTPGLNRWNAQARAIFEKGGEEAAVLHAKTAMAGSLYVAGAGMYAAGRLTGRGPSDPKLKAIWLQDHQPYSLRVGDTWVSYRKADPLGIPLGLMADIATAGIELHDDPGEDPFNLGTAFVSALASNLSSKSYLEGVTQFFNAWGSNDGFSTKKYIANFAGSFVPNALNTANSDPYYREVGGVLDGMMARTPGLSKQLLPRYDGFGNPIMKADGTLNRFLNPLRFDHVTHSSVNDALLELRLGMPQEAKKLVQGSIDLTDSRWTKDGKVPYQRLNELIASGVDGHPGREEQLRKLVTSREWKDMSSGTDLFPGESERSIRVKNVVADTHARALKQVFAEYPELKQAYKDATHLRGASIAGGQTAVSEMESLFGTRR